MAKDSETNEARIAELTEELKAIDQMMEELRAKAKAITAQAI